MKIFTVCQSGLGTSFMVQMNIQQILEEVGVDTDNFQIDHTDVGSASGDMLITSLSKKHCKML